MGAFEWTPGSLISLNQEAWKAAAIQAAVNLGIFKEVGEREGLSVPELALAAGTDPRATNMLVTALTALELLERDGPGLRLTDFSGKYLKEDSPFYLGNIIKHMSFILPAWTRLSEAVKTGSKIERPSFSDPAEGEKYDRERFRSFILGMRDVALSQGEMVACAINLSKAKKLLDLGGGPGVYAGLFCAKNPELRAVVFDKPSSEPLALGVLERLKVKDRVEFMGGDYLSSELPKGFCVAWLSQILHGEKKENAALLIKRAADAINPGGSVIVQEFVLDDGLDGPIGPALFNLNMLLQTDGGCAYTHGEIILMLESAGLTKISEIKADLTPGNRIYQGIKEA
jgi:predicted O-methyltransferase YrrM